MENGFLEFLKKYKFTILLCLIGLILVILFFTIGFWRTILLMVILALCFLVGYLLDQSGPDGLKNFVNKLFSKK
ncbi:MAG: DUF2273 domain-containing protein [Eubacteriales bacterium]|nr:DUF2273 domain-containing protein [Eubacteriales bacterium]